MSEDRKLLDIIGHLYEAAVDPNRLAGLTTTLAPHFGATSGLIHTCKPVSLEMPGVLSGTANIDQWAQSAYVEHFHEHNKYFARGAKMPVPAIVLGEELVSERELLRSEFYDFCRKIDTYHLIGVSVSIAKDRVAGVGLQRSRTHRAFEESDRRKAAQLVPHLQRALQIQHRIAALTHERDIGLDVIAGLAIGILFVTTSARLLFANRIAERVLQRGDALSVSQGRLRAADPRRQPDLERLIGEAVETSAGKGVKAGGVLSVARPAKPPLAVLVSPFRSLSVGFGPALPAAVVMFSDPDSEAAIPEKTLQMALGLTPAQARLVAALLAGQSLSEYAQAAGISINTAKTQMRQVFQRTGHDRQVDLIRAVAANPVLKLAQ